VNDLKLLCLRMGIDHCEVSRGCGQTLRLSAFFIPARGLVAIAFRSIPFILSGGKRIRLQHRFSEPAGRSPGEVEMRAIAVITLVAAVSSALNSVASPRPPQTGRRTPGARAWSTSGTWMICANPIPLSIEMLQQEGADSQL